MHGTGGSCAAWGFSRSMRLHAHAQHGRGRPSSGNRARQWRTSGGVAQAPCTGCVLRPAETAASLLDAGCTTHRTMTCATASCRASAMNTLVPQPLALPTHRTGTPCPKAHHRPHPHTMQATSHQPSPYLEVGGPVHEVDLLRVPVGVQRALTRLKLHHRPQPRLLGPQAHKLDALQAWGQLKSACACQPSGSL